MDPPVYVHKLPPLSDEVLNSLSDEVLNAPRKSCSRTSDDAMLARPVKDTDLLLLGSAHSVPWEDCFRR